MVYLVGMETKEARTMRFQTVETRYEASGTVTVAQATFLPGHVVTRERYERRTYAGRKGGAASVEWTAYYECSCGGRTGQSTTVADAMARLVHFGSPEEREQYEAEQAAKRERIMAALSREEERTA